MLNICSGFLLFYSIASINAQVALYGQCGGKFVSFFLKYLHL